MLRLEDDAVGDGDGGGQGEECVRPWCASEVRVGGGRDGWFSHRVREICTEVELKWNRSVDLECGFDYGPAGRIGGL